MSGIFIFIVVIVVTFLLGRHALREGIKIEQDKKFRKNFNKHK